MKLCTVFLLAGIAIATNAQNTSDLYVYEGHSRGKRAVLINSDPNQPCRIYGHGNPIQVMVNSPGGPTLRTVDQLEWSRIAAECQERLLSLSKKGYPSYPANRGQMDFIYPGTKWCGTGDIAANYDDLGPRVATDLCCRAHDFCSDTMKPNTCKHGLCNNGPFTRSHCDCDDEFRDCLIRAESDQASLPVGFIFFDVAGVACYKKGPECQYQQGEIHELTKRKRRSLKNYGPIGRSAETGYCFLPPKPFKIPAMLRRSQPNMLFRNVMHSVGDATTVIKRMASSHFQ